jgi:hypothetical protein
MTASSDLPIAASPTPEPVSVPLALRYFDVLLLVAFLPFAALTGIPMLGYVVGMVGWIVTRALGVWLDGRVTKAKDARTGAFIQLAGVMGRAWLMGLTILAVGLAGERKDGLTAAIEVLVAFTVYLALSLILRPQRKSS